MPRQKQSNPKPLKLQREEIQQLLIQDGPPGTQSNRTGVAGTDETSPKKKHKKHHHHSKKKKPKYKSAMKVKIADKVRNKRLAKALREKQVGKKKKKKKDLGMADLSTAVSNNNNNQDKAVSNMHVTPEVSSLLADGLSADLLIHKDKYDLIKERSSRLQQAKNKEKEKDTSSVMKKTLEKVVGHRLVPETTSADKEGVIPEKPITNDLLEFKKTEKIMEISETTKILETSKTSAKQSDQVVPSEKITSDSEEDNVSKQQALEALLQVTGVELNTMTKHRGSLQEKMPISSISHTTPSSTPTAVTTAVQQQHLSGNIVKITETETGVVKYQLRDDSLEEQGLTLVYTAQTASQINSDNVFNSAYKPRKPGRPSADADCRESKGKKPGRHVCQFCGRRCTKPSVLKKHIRSHTGERPYPCIPCGFWFKTKSNLYKHCKSHAHAIKAGLTPNPEDMEKVYFDEDNDSEETESEDEGQVCVDRLSTGTTVTLGSPSLPPISSFGSGDSTSTPYQTENIQINTAQVEQRGDSATPKVIKVERSELRQRLEKRISLNALNEGTLKEMPASLQAKLAGGNINIIPQTVHQQQRHLIDTNHVKQELGVVPPVIQTSFAMPTEITKPTDEVIMSASGPGMSDILKSLHHAEVAGFRIDMETKCAIPVLSNQMSTTQSSPSPVTSTINTSSHNTAGTPGQLVIPVTGFNIVKSGGQYHVQIPVQGVASSETANSKNTSSTKPIESVDVQSITAAAAAAAAVDMATASKAVSNESVKQRIQQLINQNEAIVDKAVLVKPRRTGLYRRDSTSTPPRLENAAGDVVSTESGPASTGRDMPILVKEGTISAQFHGNLFSLELPQRVDSQKASFDNDLKIRQSSLVADNQPMEGNLLERGLKAPLTSQMPDLAPIAVGFPAQQMGSDRPHPMTSNELALHIVNGSPLMTKPSGQYHHFESTSSSTSGSSNTIKNLLQDRQLRLEGMNPSVSKIPKDTPGEMKEVQYSHMWPLQAALQGKYPVNNSIQMPTGTTVFVPGGPPGGIYPPQPYRGYATTEDVQAMPNMVNRISNRRRKNKSESDAITLVLPSKRRGQKAIREMPELALIAKNDPNQDIPEEENITGIPPLSSPHIQLTNQKMMVPCVVQGVPHQQPHVGLLQTVPQSAAISMSDIQPQASEVSVIQHTNVSPNQSRPDMNPLRMNAQFQRQTPFVPWQPGIATQYVGPHVFPSPISVPQYLSLHSPLHSPLTRSILPTTMDTRLMPQVSPQPTQTVCTRGPIMTTSASNPIQSQTRTTPATTLCTSVKTANTVTTTTSECIPTAMQILADVANHSFQAQSTASLPTQTQTVASAGPLLSTGTSLSSSGNRQAHTPHSPLPGTLGTLSVPSMHTRRQSVPDSASRMNSPHLATHSASPLGRSSQQKRIHDYGQSKEENKIRPEFNFENTDISKTKRPKLDVPASLSEPGKKKLLKRPVGFGGCMSRGHLTLDIPSPLTGSATNSPNKVADSCKPQHKIDPKSLLTPESLSIASLVMRRASPIKPNTPSTPVETARELGRLMAHAFHNAGGKVESLLTTTHGQVVLGPIATPTPTGSKQIFLLPSPSSSQPPTPFGSLAAKSPRSPRTPAAPFPSKDTRLLTTTASCPSKDIKVTTTAPFPSDTRLLTTAAPCLSKDTQVMATASFPLKDTILPNAAVSLPSVTNQVPVAAPFLSKDTRLTNTAAPFPSKDIQVSVAATFTSKDTRLPIAAAPFPSKDTRVLVTAPFPSNDTRLTNTAALFPSKDTRLPTSAAPFLTNDTRVPVTAPFPSKDTSRLPTSAALFPSKDTEVPVAASLQSKDTRLTNIAVPFPSKDTSLLTSAAPFPSKDTELPVAAPFPSKDTRLINTAAPFSSKDFKVSIAAPFPSKDTRLPTSAAPFPSKDTEVPVAGPFPSKDTIMPVHRPPSMLPMARLTPQCLSSRYVNHFFNDEHLMTMIKTNAPLPVTSSHHQSLEFASSSTRNQLLTQGTYCCLRRSQPMYVQQGSNVKISMYSNWKAGGNSQHPLGMSWKSHMALYNSNRNKKPRLYYIFSDISPPKFGIVTQSGAWKPEQMTLKVETRQPDTPLPPQTPDLTSPSHDISATSQLEQKVNDKKPKDHHYHKHDSHRIPIFKGGFKSNEDYEYVRGRGRGKYVCEECGIRCKKPSMLKKHIRTHTDMRPYQCSICNFAFKTKGNLTKHMKSKAHNKKCIENGIIPGEGDYDQSYEDMDDPNHQFSDADDYNEDTDSADGDTSEDESESGTPVSTCTGKDQRTMFATFRERHGSVPNIHELDDSRGHVGNNLHSSLSTVVITQPASAGPLQRSFSEIFDRPRRNSMPAGSSALEGETEGDRLDHLIGELKHRTDDPKDNGQNKHDFGGTSKEDEKPMKLSRSEVVGKLSRHLTNRHQAQKAAAAAKHQPTSTTTNFDISQLPPLHPGLLYPSTQPLSVQISSSQSGIGRVWNSSGPKQGPPVLDKLGHIAILCTSLSTSSQYRLSTMVQSSVTSSATSGASPSEKESNVNETVMKASPVSSIPSTTAGNIVAYIGSMVETNAPVFRSEAQPEEPSTRPVIPISIYKSTSIDESMHRNSELSFGVSGLTQTQGQVPRPQHLSLNPTSHPDSLRLLTHAAVHQSGLHSAGTSRMYEMEGSPSGKRDASFTSFAASLAHNAYMQARVTTPTPFAAQPLLTPLHLPPGTFNRDGSPRKVPPPVVEPISDDEDEHCNKRRRLQHPEKPVHLNMPTSRLWEPQPANAIKKLLVARPQMWPIVQEPPLMPLSPFSSPFLPPSPSVTSIKTIPGPVAVMSSSHHLRPPLVSPILPSNLSQLPATILSHIRSPTQLKPPTNLVPSLAQPSSPLESSIPFVPPVARAKTTTAQEQCFQMSPKGKSESPAVVEVHEEEVNTSPPPHGGHSGNHKCSTCFKVFMKPNQLRIHMRTHIEEQMFKCQECTLEFCSRSLLAKHERTELHLSKVEAVELPTVGNEDPRPFKCKLCQIAFRIRGHLAKHLRSRGHIASLEREGTRPISKQDKLIFEILTDDENDDYGQPHSPTSSDKTDSASECGDYPENTDAPLTIDVSAMT